VVYLTFQILWFLVAAAVIGFVVGWLCRSLAILRRREMAAMQARAAQGELEGQREQLETRLAEATSAREVLQEEIAQARQAAKADAKTRRKLEREHSSALIKLEAREREVARLGAELEARQGEIAAPQPAPPAGSDGDADDRERVSALGRTPRNR
jgi:flagellar biosynthesis/type III secretory pathway M-ring protein FliF/YscJ